MNAQTIISKILWTLPFMSFMAGYWFMSTRYPVQGLSAPHIVGLSAHQAVTVLSSLNLNLRIISHKEDADLEPGTILTQTPLAGQKIKPHQSIFVMASTQEPPPLMPSLYNKKEPDIVAELKNRGLHQKLYYVPSSKPSGTCVAQFPCPEQPILEKNVLVYLAHNAPRPVIMPTLRGLTMPELQEVAHLHNVKIEHLHAHKMSPHHMCTACVVVDQRPLAGSILTLDDEKPLHIHVLFE